MIRLPGLSDNNLNIKSGLKAGFGDLSICSSLSSLVFKNTNESIGSPVHKLSNVFCIIIINEID